MFAIGSNGIWHEVGGECRLRGQAGVNSNGDTTRCLGAGPVVSKIRRGGAAKEQGVGTQDAPDLGEGAMLV